MAPRLKVFVTSDGLTDYVVATTSKAKALAAWGFSQDVFKEGHAHETDDPALVKAATAKPGEVLRRPAGTRGELAKLKPAKPAKPKGQSPAQLRKVADLERELAGLTAQRDADLARLDREAGALAKRRQAVEAKAEAQRSCLEAQLTKARAAIG